MSRLPTVGGDSGTWGTVLNDYLTETAVHTTLADSPVLGATTLEVATVPPGLAVGSVVVIDAYTTEAEIRTVSGISGNTVTVSATKFAHASGDTVRLLGDTITIDQFGITGGAADWFVPLQRLVIETPDAVWISGMDRQVSISKPLILATSKKLRNVYLSSHSSFSPIEPGNCMVTMALRNSAFTATASDNTFTTPAAHGFGVGTQIAFSTIYGGTLPSPLVAGRFYYVKTTPTGTTFTISETLGGAEFDLTVDGSGHAHQSMAETTLGRVFWESVRIDVNLADLNGVRLGLQQPSWTRNTRIEQNVACTVTTYGMILGGQNSYHDNVEINPDSNCVALSISGTGMVVRNFNCNANGTNNTGIVVTGQSHMLMNLWTESLTVGMEVRAAIGLTIGGSWVGQSAPAIKVTDGQASYDLGIVRMGSANAVIVQDDVRSITISSWNGSAGSSRTGDTDQDLVFHGLWQPYDPYGNLHAPILKCRVAQEVSTDWTVTHRTKVVNAQALSSDVTITLPSAVGWRGWDTTVTNSGGSHNVIVATTSSQTIDGASTVTVAPGGAITVTSNGSNYYSSSRKLPGSPQTYAPTNVTTDRAFDADTVVIAELADVVGTLIADLQARKVIG